MSDEPQRPKPVVVRFADLLKAIDAARKGRGEPPWLAPAESEPIAVIIEPVEPTTPEFVWTIMSRFDSLESAVRDAESAAKSVLRCVTALPPALPAEPKARPPKVEPKPKAAVASEPEAYDPGAWRHDAPKDLVRRQLEVCARELGLEVLTERFVSVSLESLRRMLSGGATVPMVEADELDRLYVIVRMAQFDLEPDDDEIEEVRQLIRKRQRDELRHMAEAQRA